MKSFFLKPRNLVLGALALLSLGIVAYPAFASVTITPMLVLIEGRNRYADVNLINTSNKTESYVIDWKFFKMEEETGKYQDLESSMTDFDLSKHIAVSPRRVTIEPGGMQKIRLGLRLKGEPPAAGDYRAHLELKSDSTPGPVEKLEKGQVKIGVKVNVGFSIPVVYRVGESDATASIGDVKTQINPNNNALEAVVPVTRTGGPYGMLGHLIVKYDGKIIGEVKNANIFHEINTRIFKVPLTVSQLSGGNLEIIYKDFDAKKNTVFAEKNVPVGN